jgi:hypothetical protein
MVWRIPNECCPQITYPPLDMLRDRGSPTGLGD